MKTSTKSALTVLGTAAVFAVMLLGEQAKGPAAITVPTESAGAQQMHLVTGMTTLTTHYGTFRAPEYAFVRISVPTFVERVVVDVACCSYPAAVNGGERSIIPVRAEGRGWFYVRLNTSSVTPYLGPALLSDLPKVSSASKRRSVRQ